MRKAFSSLTPHSFAVEGTRAPGANGIAPGAGHEPDPDWQSL